MIQEICNSDYINKYEEKISVLSTCYLYSRLEGGGARDNGIGLKTQLAGSVSSLLVPWSLQLK